MVLRLVRGCFAALLAAAGILCAQSTVVPTSSVTADLGTTVNLTGSAGAFRYIWSKDGATLSDGITASGSAIAGSQTATLQISGLTASDAGSYEVLPVDIHGVTYNGLIFILTVNPPAAPAIRTPPVNVTVDSGAKAAFTVVTGGSYPQTFQWLFDGAPIPNATFATYTIAAAGSATAGTYTVAVTNAFGSIVSPPAQLTINGPSLPTESGTGGVTTVPLGGTLNLSSPFLGGSPGATYQWYHDSLPVPGATQGTYPSNLAAKLGDGGDYTLVASNAAGSVVASPQRIQIAGAAAASALSPWLDARQAGTVMYFLFPARIERFDLAAGQWLPPVPLSQQASCFAVSTDTIYVGDSLKVDAYPLDDLAHPTLLLTPDGDTVGIYAGANYLYLLENPTIPELVSCTYAGQIVGSHSVTDSIGTQGLAIAPLLARAYQSDGQFVHALELAANGDVKVAGTQTPSDWGLSPGTRTYLFPDQSLVANNSGAVYEPNSLTPVGGLGGPFDDLTFLADGTPVVLRGYALAKYGGVNFSETGRATLAHPASRIAAFASTIWAFAGSSASPGIQATAIDASTLVPASSPAILDDARIKAAPAGVVVGRNGTVYLLDRLSQSILPWSPASLSFLPAIPLSGVPLSFTYSATLDRIYCSYTDGRLTKIDLGGTAGEQPFALLAGHPQSIVACDDYLMISGAGQVLDANGAFTSSAGFTFSTPPAWSSQNHALYVASANSTLDILPVLSPGAVFSNGRDTVDAVPAFPAPDGTTAIDARGQIYDAVSGRLTGALPIAFTDAAWLGSGFYTLRTTAAGAEIQSWALPTLQLLGSAQLSGAVGRLLPLPGNLLLALTISPAGTEFTLLDSNLQLQAQSGPQAPVGGAPTWVTQPPAALAVLGGASPTLTAVAEGADSIGYQWFKDGTPLAGATHPELTLRRVSQADAGTYTVTATNSAGSVTGAGTALAVDILPDITVEPQGMTAASANLFTLSVTATGPTPFRYQWLRDGVPIVGAIESSYQAFSPLAGNIEVYAVNLVTPAGSVTSADAIVVAGSDTATTPDTTGNGTAYVTTPGSIVDFTQGDSRATITSEFNGQRLVGDFGQFFGIAPVSAAHAGTYSATISNPLASAQMSQTLALVGWDLRPLPSAPPARLTVAADASLTLSAQTAARSYQWYLNGSPIAGATDSTYAASPAQAGRYAVVATNDSGNAIGAITQVELAAPAAVAPIARLINLSSRATTASDASALATGFVIGGTGPKQVLVRAVGPALAGFGIADSLSDPLLALYDGSSRLLDASAAWGGQGEVALVFSAVGAFALPATSADAALLALLPPGSYTAQITPAASTGGIALAEIYDADAAPGSARLVNLSARGQVSPGTGVLAGGFTIGGSGTETVLIRGVGPTLASFGVDGALSAPVLTVYDSSQRAIATNGGWAGSAALTAAFAKTGAFPFQAGSVDCALVLTLAPGTYSAQVSGANGTSGIALVEIYEDN